MAKRGREEDSVAKDHLNEKLVAAAGKGDLALVKHLITSEKANPNAEVSPYSFRGGRTPAAAAAEKGHWDVVSYLMDSAGIDRGVGPQRDIVKAALRVTSSGQQKEAAYGVLAKIIGHGGDMDPYVGDDIRAIHIASRNGDLRAVKMLLAGGSDPSVSCNQGYSPIVYAVKSGQWRVALELATSARFRSDTYVFDFHNVWAAGVPLIAFLVQHAEKGAVKGIINSDALDVLRAVHCLNTSLINKSDKNGYLPIDAATSKTMRDFLIGELGSLPKGAGRPNAQKK